LAFVQTINEPRSGDDNAAGPWGRRAALIKATVNEIRVLARAHRLTKDKNYLKSAIEGIDFILRAQWPSGAWPHSFPNFRTRYDRYATFADDEMTDLMRLLRQIVTDPDFEAVPTDSRAAVQQAFDRGVDFILKCQVVVDGTPTAWAQQHDEGTYEPRAARAFEPVALSAGESASVLTLLMSIQNPSQTIINAISGGASWYEQVKIAGIRIDRGSDDRTVVCDPSAPTIWSRFYQIDNNRPIFAGRDGVVRYRLAEIEKERRAGYAWYGYWGKDVLEQYSIWKRLIERSPQ
jgi:PelA/Pel-15E family pectate lyase